MFSKDPQLTSAPSNHLNIAEGTRSGKKNTKQALTKKIREYSHKIAEEMLGVYTATLSKSKFTYFPLLNNS